jgi:hypothetical protein
MKNRNEEMLVLKELNPLFGENIIPLIEIIKDEYKTEYIIDDKTGEFVYEQNNGGKRRNRVKKSNSDERIITLDEISKIVDDKCAFIDFFRFSLKEYKGVDYNKLQLSLRLVRDELYYRDRILEIKNYKNLYPVISIKDDIDLSFSVINELLTKLGESKQVIAIRITDSQIEKYYSLIESTLRETDFLMIDIREQNVRSKDLELKSLADLPLKCKKIVLNSPRKVQYKNGNYESDSFTNLIDVSLVNKYKEYGYFGFGDYGGLKDDLPRGGGSNGQGCALALIYFNESKFYSVVNPNKELGVKGYKEVKNKIADNRDFFDPSKTCPAINRIINMGQRTGTWKTWNNITLTRYLNQISQNYM